ncbi:formylglycine-generating enzyme family protein [Paenibacillus macerans]|uniref:formylglycine-generating enzyme family protein n=1 Tax=Paenibacillus macerans TaxID=44252 RepID=UPI0022E00908|nr:formylglycine-generating enzyme family protein [Paenibacillus macerans]
MDQDHNKAAPSCCSPKRSKPGVVRLGSGAAAFAANGGRPKAAGAKTAGVQSNMVRLEGGTFLMGTDDKEGFPSDGEGPVREVTVSPFYIDSYAVTNRQFSEFVRATGYRTDAEKFGNSFVFHLFLPPDVLADTTNVVMQTPWWRLIEGADWRHPEGPASGLQGRMDHPAVHVSWRDAEAYCRWAGKRLPTEAEWEYAARGGLAQKKYPWGDELTPEGKHMCNIWQGKFPVQNEALDGYAGTAPVNAFEPNGYGLYNMAGNVWEWCADWFDVRYHRTQGSVNPKGPSKGSEKSMRGGSYLCHHSYCNRYRVAARSRNSPDSSSGNAGFRCAADA